MFMIPLTKEEKVFHQWIKVVEKDHTGKRATGYAEAAAFNRGLEYIKSEPWECVVKLDGDVRFSSEYCGTIMDHFKLDANLGIASGVYLEQKNGE
jgi:hypothetical protein